VPEAVEDDELPHPDIPRPSTANNPATISRRTPRDRRPTNPTASSPANATPIGTGPNGAFVGVTAETPAAGARVAKRRRTFAVAVEEVVATEEVVVAAVHCDESVYTVNVAVTAAVPLTAVLAML
jgi:hypothetical protein